MQGVWGCGTLRMQGVWGCGTLGMQGDAGGCRGMWYPEDAGECGTLRMQGVQGGVVPWTCRGMQGDVVPRGYRRCGGCGTLRMQVECSSLGMQEVWGVQEDVMWYPGDAGRCRGVWFCGDAGDIGVQGDVVPWGCRRCGGCCQMSPQR